jgi:hypothetical protein
MKTFAPALMDTVLWTLHSLRTSAGGFRGGSSEEEMLQHCRAGEENPVKDFGRGICIGSLMDSQRGIASARPTMPSITATKRATRSAGIGKWIAP